MRWCASVRTPESIESGCIGLRVRAPSAPARSNSAPVMGWRSWKASVLTCFWRTRASRITFTGSAAKFWDACPNKRARLHILWNLNSQDGGSALQLLTEKLRHPQQEDFLLPYLFRKNRIPLVEIGKSLRQLEGIPRHVRR